VRENNRTVLYCVVYDTCAQSYTHIHTYTYEQFLKMIVGLGLVFVHLFKFSILHVFWFILDCFFLVLFALLLVSSVLYQQIGRKELLQNDLFCIEWDVKP